MNWQTVIGLEVHAKLNTKSKLFSNAPTTSGTKPNTQTNYIDAGFPGVLPVLNKKAVEMAILFGLAINAKINNLSYFERKNYFYPDLPKGYQISQYQRPIVENGYININTSDNFTKKIIIHRAHLEEDAGKSLHDNHKKYTGIDLNRAGNPLIEIVTSPCINSKEEAISYLKTLHQLLLFLKICDGNMQDGSFRCDVNLSVKPYNSTTLGTKVELKNLNSFRFIEKAIQFEEERQIDLLESGEKIIQETRLYDQDKNQTKSMRFKENENDYRYFPDPDLLPIQITENELINLKKNMPCLPSKLAKDLKIQDLLPDELIEFLLSSYDLMNFYNLVKQETNNTSCKTIANWLKTTYLAVLNEQHKSFKNPPISAKRFAELLDKLSTNILSNTTAKKIFYLMLEHNEDIDLLINQAGFLKENQDIDLKKIIQDIIIKYAKQFEEYKSGKEKLLGFFMGEIMKLTKGAAKPNEIKQIIEQLSKDNLI